MVDPRESGSPSIVHALVPKQFANRNQQIQGVMTGALAALGVTFLIPQLQPLARWCTTAVLLSQRSTIADQPESPSASTRRAHAS
jgi:hypothetical protein